MKYQVSFCAKTWSLQSTGVQGHTESESYKLRNIRVLHNNGIINDESLSAIWVPRIRSFYPLHFVTKLKIHHPSSSSLDHVKSIRFFFEWIKSHSPNLSTSVMSSLFVHLWTSLSFMLQQSLCNLKWESKFFTSDLLSKTLLLSFSTESRKTGTKNKETTFNRANVNSTRRSLESFEWKRGGVGGEPHWMKLGKTRVTKSSGAWLWFWNLMEKCPRLLQESSLVVL